MVRLDQRNSEREGLESRVYAALLPYGEPVRTARGEAAVKAGLQT